MRNCLFVVALFFALHAGAGKTTNNLWSELAAKREALPALHQEFEVRQEARTRSHTQGSERTLVLDFSQRKWRERWASGSGDSIRIFDGQDLFQMEDGDDEFMRVKHKSKEDPTPSPYSLDVDWERAKELQRVPCGFSGSDHECITIESPMKHWVEAYTSGHTLKMFDGVARLVMDSETGILVHAETRESIDDGYGGYQILRSYALKQATYGKAPDAALFSLPASGLREVKRLTPWSVDRIKKQLVGKPAPALNATDIQGNPISLSELKGKTVLLDFWTTWCPPCLADAPALDKLYAKYGQQGLAIVGVSVSENRTVVEKFLKDHPKHYPVILTTENEVPRPYQVGAFPTYIVIAPDGTLTSVADGDQGFGQLRKSLKKAGMDVD